MKNEKIDEELIMKASKLYAEICSASKRGKQRGMRIGDIKEKYGLKNRDLKTLFGFLARYDDEIGEYNGQIRCIVYKISEEQIEEDKLQLLEYDKIVDDGREWDTEKFDDDCFLIIEDSISVLSEKITEENIDITNASLFSKLAEDKTLRKMWNQISEVSLEENYIVDKGNNNEKKHILEKNKKQWIRAIVKSRCVSMLKCGTKNAEEVFPYGLFYDAVIDCYICVYQKKNSQKLQDIRLEYIEKLEEHELCDEKLYFLDKEGERKRKQEFDIHEYIEAIQRETMKLKVYKEAKVIDKLKALLEENQCNIKEEKDFFLVCLKTDDPHEYLKKFNSYGRSVIVLEPEDIMEFAMGTIDKTLNKYEILREEEKITRKNKI